MNTRQLTKTRIIGCILLFFSLFVLSPGTLGEKTSPPNGAITNPPGGRIIHQIGLGYHWGFWSGVKQPVGSFRNGLSIHHIEYSNYPLEVATGNPDCIFWVDEAAGTFGISDRPTGTFQSFVIKPGGMATFGHDGTIWYTFGANAMNLPLDLYKSTAPSDIANFTLMVNDFETQGASTTPCVLVNDPNLMLFWRHGFSAGSNTTVRLRRYDINTGFGSFASEFDIGQGAIHPTLGAVGIEQFWTRRDPRFNQAFLSWQWFDGTPPHMGSNPFLYSDDDGLNWRKADGSLMTNLPVNYNQIDPILVPHDHLALGQHTAWYVEDIGISPNGTHWMTTRVGHTVQDDSAVVYFWFFNGTAWESRTLTGGLLGDCKPYACGVTLNGMVFLYSDFAEQNILKAKISTDDGRTWSAPIFIDILDPTQAISWASFVQPSDSYTDDTARFFYAYYNAAEGIAGRRYNNNINYVSLDLTVNSTQACSVILGGANDCNSNGINDVCDIANGFSIDCNSNQIPDECESPADECMCQNTGGTWIIDSCGNYVCGILQPCNIPSPGCDCGYGRNFVPGVGCVTDPNCPPPPCFADCAPAGGNGLVNIDDLVAVLNAFGANGGPCDVTPTFPDGTHGNGLVNIDDLVAVLNGFGPCP